jgi:methylenetetrahydrofolate dehydrogenase (NADP+)/methenyltetrahydrofolate cyclohydrolase
MNEITILDGIKVSNEIKEDLRRDIKKLPRKPRMSIIMVGDDQASQAYVNAKVRSCKEVGIDCQLILMPEETRQIDLLNQISSLNDDSKVDGYIVQLPLPQHIDKDKVIDKISPEKDIDGFHHTNIGRMTLNLPTILPATPFGIMSLIRHYNIELEGKNCVVIGRSDIVGLPISIMMGHDDQCTVTSCHVNTNNLKDFTKMADILIVSVGIPNFVTEDMVKEDSVVIDVGINRDEEGTLIGDVDFDNVSKKTSYITPVPGGVGPMTIVSLMRNLVYATKNNVENGYY